MNLYGGTASLIIVMDVSKTSPLTLVMQTKFWGVTELFVKEHLTASDNEKRTPPLFIVKRWR
jgi:hypothetical protein